MHVRVCGSLGQATALGHPVFACRAGTTTAFHRGESLTVKQANFRPSHRYRHPWYSHRGSVEPEVYLERPTEVGSYPPNAFGVHDVHGNVDEWCADWHQGYTVEAVVDPTGPRSASYRVFRGGSWSHTPKFSRSAIRNFNQPKFQQNTLGFRVAADRSGGPGE
ncbi:MAG: formylglycine-generating enzyme family protein [Planctomycetales bacterium]